MIAFKNFGGGICGGGFCALFLTQIWGSGWGGRGVSEGGGGEVAQIASFSDRKWDPQWHSADHRFQHLDPLFAFLCMVADTIEITIRECKPEKSTPSVVNDGIFLEYSIIWKIHKSNDDLIRCSNETHSIRNLVLSERFPR